MEFDYLLDQVLERNRGHRTLGFPLHHMTIT